MWAYLLTLTALLLTHHSLYLDHWKPLPRLDKCNPGPLTSTHSISREIILSSSCHFDDIIPCLTSFHWLLGFPIKSNTFYLSSISKSFPIYSTLSSTSLIIMALVSLMLPSEIRPIIPFVTVSFRLPKNSGHCQPFYQSLKFSSDTISPENEAELGHWYAGTWAAWPSKPSQSYPIDRLPVCFHPFLTSYVSKNCSV